MIDPQVTVQLGNEIDELRKENALLKRCISELEEALDEAEQTNYSVDYAKQSGWDAACRYLRARAASTGKDYHRD